MKKQPIDRNYIAHIVASNYNQLLEETNKDNIDIINSIYNKYNTNLNSVRINQDIFTLIHRISRYHQVTEKNDWVQSSLWGIYHSICGTGKSGIHLDIEKDEYRLLRDFLRMNNKKFITSQVDDYIMRFNEGYQSTNLYTLEPTGDVLEDLKQLRKDFNWSYNIVTGTDYWFKKVKMLIEELDIEINKLQA